MTTKITALDDLILALVAAFDAAVTYPVTDGPPSKQMPRGTSKYLAVFASEAEDQSQADDSATMEQSLYGLGQIAREETLNIKCVAGGRARDVTQARSIAMSVVQDAGANIPKHPTNETYGCFISQVESARPHNVAGGAVVTIQFTITASARLT